MLEVTGERLVPDRQHDELVFAEHLVRYRFAAQFSAGRTVLDAACGEGYGAALIAAAGATSVTGVDVDPATVAQARAKYGLDFQQADVASLPFEDDRFDIIVSFETIEHVQDPASVLAEFGRVLRPDGLLIISTPNADQYLSDNEFHAHEFSSDEFARLLAEHFDRTTTLYQQNWLTSAILEREQFTGDGSGRPVDLDLYKEVSQRPGQELYSIVLCGSLPATVGQLAVASGIYEAHKLTRLYESWVERAGEAERVNEAWLARAREAERQVTEARRTIDSMRRSVSWRLTAPLRLAKGRLPGRNRTPEKS